MKRMKINVNQIVLCIESLFVTDILLLKIRKLFIHNRLLSLLFCVLLKYVCLIHIIKNANKFLTQFNISI